MIGNAAICTIASKNKLGYVRTLYNSAREYMPKVDFYLLLVDRADDFFSIKNESFKVIQLSELDNISCSPSLFFEHDQRELEQAFKPYFFEMLFKKFKVQRLICFDPEVLVLNNLACVWNLLEKTSLVLVPRFSGHDTPPDEMDVLNAGVFRQGFIGMSNTSATLSFLQDQEKHLFNFCSVEGEKHNGIHPRKLGSLSWLLKEVCLFDNPSVLSPFNVFYRETSLFITKEGKVKLDKQPLLFLNFRGANLKDLEMNVKDHEELSVYRHLFDHYQHLLKINGQPEAQKWPNAYDFFDNGVRIPILTRKIYRNCKGKGVYFENPFLTKGENTFFGWLNEPVGSGMEKFRCHTTRIMSEIYESRPDLKRVFPTPLGKNKEIFLTWFERCGLKEYQIDRKFLPKPQVKNLFSYLYGMKRLFYWFLSYSIPQFLEKIKAFIWHGFIRLKTIFSGFLPLTKSKKGRIHSSALPFGVNVIGSICGEFGIGEAARSSIRALQSAGVPHVINNIDLHLHRNMDSSFSQFSKANPYRLNLVHINAPETKEVINQKGKEYFKNRYNIGFWFWELSCFPEEWLPFFRYYDEVWVASRFCQESVSKVSPIPVTKMTLPVIFEEEIENNRSKFLLSEDDFIFLFAFDFRSSFERKNPLAIIEAFSRAFSEKDHTLLVMKVINADYFPLKKALLQSAVIGKRIRLIDGHLSSNDLSRLTVCCDCFVSLHRSEGLGMGMAKAMYLGKPVIATGYSGNMDFMNHENSFLVKYDLVEVIEDDGPYKQGNVWADPDIDHAAQLMQLIYNDRRLSENKSRQAAQDIKNFMNPKITGKEMMGRLRKIAEHQ